MKVEDIVKIDIDKDIFDLVSDLESIKEKCKDIKHKHSTILLRKASMIRSINSSLAIEGNTLGPLSVREMINGRQVVGPFDEIVELKNAIEAYGKLSQWKTWSMDDFLDAFDVLMFGLVEEPGFRKVGVGIFEGERMIYRAPESKDVVPFMERLFDWCRGSKLPSPIVAAVAHFHIESIHPFVDGNGRMGRLWNTKVLLDDDPLYGLVPMETYIRRRQDEYYSILERSQSEGMFDCTEFVKFCLECSIQAFSDLTHLRDGNMIRLLERMGDDTVTVKELMERMGFGSRDKFMKNYIGPALEFGFITRTQSSDRNRYQSYRRIV